MTGAAPTADLSTIGRPVQGQRPWPRAIASEADWSVACAGLADGRWSLLGLWAEARQVHMALRDERANAIAVLSLHCPDGRFPSVGRFHPPALRLERAIRDLFGLEPVGSPDPRPWLDHGAWAVRQPLGSSGARGDKTPYVFLTAEGPGLHQIAVGPVHAGIIEPGHFRFHASGETVVRLEQRLGYTHKGVEGLMAGMDLARAARLAGRVSGDSTVAYAFAFARAAEAALGIEPPERALWLRALMAELERLANHFGDIGAICNDASFAILHAHCSVLRERVLRTADECFGHRLMRDCIIPGGVAVDLSLKSAIRFRALRRWLGKRFGGLVSLYDSSSTLQDRTVGTGILKSELAQQFGAGGYVGRASGRDFDARRRPGYRPYDRLDFEVPVLQPGDVDARVWIRIREVEQSLKIVDQILDRVEDGPLAVDLPHRAGEGIALVEGFRGDILVWLRLDERGLVARCHLRDPSWFQWPLLEAAIEGNIVADFPLCNKSFNCSYSGHDL